jgi:hypothetical protein
LRDSKKKRKKMENDEGTYGDESLVIKLDRKGVETFEKSNNECNHKSQVADPGLKGRFPRQIVAGHALDLQRLHEPDVGEEDRQPGERTGHGDHRDEVVAAKGCRGRVRVG